MRLRVTPCRRRREGCALIQGAATDATKIIAFRCLEGGTTAFDKTFSATSLSAPSAISSLLGHTPPTCGSRYYVPLPIYVCASFLAVCFYCNTSQTGTKMAPWNSGENSECGFLLVPLRIAMHRAQLEPSG